MFFNDHKKAISTIMAKRTPSGDRASMPMKAEKVMDEAGEPDGRHAAMEDFMLAHKEGSAMKMSDAMKNFMDIHMATPPFEADKIEDEG